MQASAAAPVEYQRPRRFAAGSIAPTVAAVVAITSVADTLPVPLSTTWFVGIQVKVGRFCAPVGLLVTAALNATVPVKPGEGATVTIAVLPELAPWPASSCHHSE